MATTNKTRVEVCITLKDECGGNYIEKYELRDDPKEFQHDIYKELNGGKEEDFVDIAGVMLRRGSISYIDVCYTQQEDME